MGDGGNVSAVMLDCEWDASYTFGGAQHWMELHCSTFALRKVAMLNSGSFEEAIIALEVGVYLVHLSNVDDFGTSIEHFVAVDSRHVAVYDSCGRTVLRLTSGVFASCKSDSIADWKLVEVRRLWRQNQGKSGRRNKRKGKKSKVDYIQ